MSAGRRGFCVLVVRLYIMQPKITPTTSFFQIMTHRLTCPTRSIIAYQIPRDTIRICFRLRKPSPTTPHQKYFYIFFTRISTHFVICRTSFPSSKTTYLGACLATTTRAMKRSSRQLITTPFASETTACTPQRSSRSIIQHTTSDGGKTPSTLARTATLWFCPPRLVPMLIHSGMPASSGYSTPIFIIPAPRREIGPSSASSFYGSGGLVWSRVIVMVSRRPVCQKSASFLTQILRRSASLIPPLWYEPVISFPPSLKGGRRRC